MPNPRCASQKTDFSARLIAWQAHSGRHGLPWQGQRNPYPVWLSEIMLQQTQVATVISYYEKFLRLFPTVHHLARADEDSVLAAWAGLGYYSRARNLHRSAQIIVQDWDGDFPPTAQTLAQLPGIGMSTAAAIAAFCYGERAAIFDANVQRVLARYCGFTADLAMQKNKNELWEIACTLLPLEDCYQNMPRYTQAIMDCGATVCTARNPRCSDCPVQGTCAAKATGRTGELPLRRKTLVRRNLDIHLLWVLGTDGAITLEKRPAKGIWGALYALPEIDAPTYRAWCQHPHARAHAPIAHTLTHRDLQIWIVQIPESDTAPGAFLNAHPYLPDARQNLALPRPLQSLLQASN